MFCLQSFCGVNKIINRLCIPNLLVLNCITFICLLFFFVNFFYYDFLCILFLFFLVPDTDFCMGNRPESTLVTISLLGLCVLSTTLVQRLNQDVRTDAHASTVSLNGRSVEPFYLNLRCSLWPRTESLATVQDRIGLLELKGDQQ